MTELILLVTVARVILLLISLRGVRPAYAGFAALGLLYFPLKSGFYLQLPSCEVGFGFALAIHSFTNYRHIVMFALFFLLTGIQFDQWKPRDMAGAAALTLFMGLLLELAEGATHQGHCRMRDLLPDSAGILLGLVLAPLLRIFWRPKPTWSFVSGGKDGWGENRRYSPV